MRLATREEIKKIDQVAATKFGLNSATLVQRVGKEISVLLPRLLKLKKSSKTRIAVWCGPGLNGDDGRALAGFLKKQKFLVDVVEGTAWSISSYSVIIDALFGVGLNRMLSPEICTFLQKVNAQKNCQRVALDLPTGLDPNTGTLWGAAFKAHWTLTIRPAKPGLFLQEGPQYAGRIRGVDIGFPPELLAQEARSVFLFGKSSAKKILPSRTATANKSKFGHLLIISGSEGMEGAALLCAEAAARMGCGYISLASSSERIFNKAKPDFIQSSIEQILKGDLKKYSAVVIGPGLGVNATTAMLLDHLLKNHDKVLVDADALTVLAQKPRNLKPTWVLTPHSGELSRFLGVSAGDIESDRLGNVQRTVLQTKAMVLLKGFRTVLGTPGKSYIVGSGNVALAKAGSGDVLSGFIGSLMAQGLDGVQAACLGAYFHGKIADDWLRRGHSNRSLMASDLPELLDASLRNL